MKGRSSHGTTETSADDTRSSSGRTTLDRPRIKTDHIHTKKPVTTETPFVISTGSKLSHANSNLKKLENGTLSVSVLGQKNNLPSSVVLNRLPLTSKAKEKPASLPISTSKSVMRKSSFKLLSDSGPALPQHQSSKLTARTAKHRNENETVEREAALLSLRAASQPTEAENVGRLSTQNLLVGLLFL